MIGATSLIRRQVILAILAISASLALCPALAASCAAEATGPDVFLLDAAQLERSRQNLRVGDRTLQIALAALVQAADPALEAGPFSVINKDAVPPSGDKRDYMSLAPYWWPNPETRDGLPYIRRDGERNPEIHKLRNRLELGAMADAVETLALAYFFTGQERYADRAALLIRHWFIEEATGMKPHLRYAQAIRGVNEGRGEGLIETRAFVRVVDAVGMLSGSKAWTDADQHAIEAWFAKFLDWMLQSELGRDEAASENNHGTFYDVQVVSYALFLRRQDLARDVLASVGKRRIAVQIEPDGRQPLELARTKAWSYSVGNLAGLIALARLGEHADIELWNYQTADGRGIRKAVDFLAPFGIGERTWPYAQINGWSADLFYPLLRIAAVKYPDAPYRDMLSKIPSEAGEPSSLWLSPIEPINELHLR